ncbi:MAG: universal stress protein [Haloarculaceae archaeon]
MTRNVIVPVDGSPLSREALRHALTTFPDASVTVLHVVDVYEPGYGGATDAESAYEPLMGSEEWYDRAEEASERVLDEARAIADDHDREVSTASEIGDPQRVVVDYVDEEDVDHVVLGAHGRTDERRSLFGSVAEAVARRSPVPVTLIR